VGVPGQQQVAGVGDVHRIADVASLLVGQHTETVWSGTEGRLNLKRGCCTGAELGSPCNRRRGCRIRASGCGES